MNPSPPSTGSPAQDSSTSERKRQLRARLLARRHERARLLPRPDDVGRTDPPDPPGIHPGQDTRPGRVSTEERIWREHLLDLVAGTGRDPARETSGAGSPATAAPTPLTIAAYLPTRWEPPLREGLAALAARGHRILAPISLPGHRLDWAAWTPSTPERLTRFGVAEPEGPRLGPEAFLEAQLRLVPALAVDAAGVRLGYGGGFYDMALASGGSGRTVGVVFREELLPAGAVPSEPHDARVLEVLTEEGLLRPDGTPLGHG